MKKTELHQVIGPSVVNARMEQRLNQSDLAELSSVSIPTVRQIENSGGTINSLLSMVDALGLRLHWTGLDLDQGYGKSIAERRAHLGLSQRKLAAKLSCSHRTIIALENGFRGRVETLEQCLSVLKLRPTLRSASINPHTDEKEPHWVKKLLSSSETPNACAPKTALICGDALGVLRSFPPSSVDCVVTSPPYWQQRRYAAGGIGNEATAEEYINNLANVFHQVHRVLKHEGSLWINIDDTYHQKTMQGIPWRLILKLVKQNGWLVRNDVIWNKTGGNLNRASDRLGHGHEHLFHLTKSENYYYVADAIRVPPKQARRNGTAPIAATGLTEAACAQRIDTNNKLSAEEKTAALAELASVFEDIANGRLQDVRMILRGENRITHSEDQTISGRAQQLRDNGYYFLRYDPRGSLPTDVLTLAPERSKGRDLHYAAYPTSLCEMPITATCPPEGIVLDPFAGTGTTMVAAQALGRRSVGIDLSDAYLKIASERLGIGAEAILGDEQR